MTITEAKETIYANVVYACEKAGLAPQTTRLVQDACDTIIAIADACETIVALADRKTEPQTIVMVKDHGRKQALEMIDSYHKLKTENCSEKPNNSTISKMEQVETMSCAECKHRPIGAEICEEPCHYEPQTDWHYDEQDATWYPYKHEDEPQQKSCATCKHALGNWDGESNNCGRCCGADRRFYEPIEDEPQMGVDWKDQMWTEAMRSCGFNVDGYRQGQPKDEPQTERSE